MDIILFLQCGNNPAQPFPVHTSPDFPDGYGIGGLYADFQLHQPRTQGLQKRDFFFRKDIRRYLKMKIGYPVIL